MKKMKKYLFALFLFFVTFFFSECYDDSDLYVQQREAEIRAQNNELQDDVMDNTSPEDGMAFWDGFLIIVITIGLAGLIVWFFISMVPLKLWFNANFQKLTFRGGF